MNILVVTSLFPYESKKNCGTFVYDFCAQMSESNNTVEVISVPVVTVRNFKQVSCKYNKKKVSESFVVHEYPGLFFCSTIFPRLNTLLFQKRIKEMLPSLQHKPDIVVCHFSFPAGISVSEMNAFNDLPVVVVEHHSLYLKDKINGFIKRSTKKEIKKSKRIICVSEHLRDNFLRHVDLADSDKIVVLPNIMNPNFSFKGGRTKNPFYFLSVGNLVENKGMSELVEAFCLEFKNENDKHLMIVGSGPLEKHIVEIINKHNAHNVTLLGGVPHDEIYKYYDRANVFCLLSKFETFGIAYREAIISGCYIISLRNEGILIDWKPSMGILLENNDVVAVRNALRSSINNYCDETLRENAELLKQKYLTNVIVKYQNLFEDVCRNYSQEKNYE